MRENHNDLGARIASWLDRQGYPLEMRVAQTLRESGYSVNQGEYFLDHEEGKYREIDVMAQAHYDVSGRWLFAELHVECKLAASKPWLVFASDPGILPEADIMLGAATKPALHLALKVTARAASTRSQYPDSTVLPSLPWGVHGYAAIEALKDRGNAPDPAYIALGKVAKSIADVRHRPRTEYDCYWFAFPIVVIDGPLFSARLDGDGKIDVQPIDSAAISVDVPGAPEGLPCIVSVVRYDVLPLFAAKYNEIMNELATGWKQEILDILPGDIQDDSADSR